MAGGELDDEAQEDAGRRPVQWQTGRVVDLDVPTAQLCCNPAGELAIRGDEGGGRARRFELAAEQRGNCYCLFLRTRAVVAAEPRERVGMLRRQTAPGIGGGRRPQGFRD